MYPVRNRVKFPFKFDVLHTRIVFKYALLEASIIFLTLRIDLLDSVNCFLSKNFCEVKTC